jgi:hypothetical protein
LLRDFGCPIVQAPELPFWHLQEKQRDREGRRRIWEVVPSDNLKMRKDGKRPLRSELIAKDVRGGFTDEVYQKLISDKSLLTRVASVVLQVSV